MHCDVHWSCLRQSSAYYFFTVLVTTTKFFQSLLLPFMKERKRNENSYIKYFASKKSSLMIICWEQRPNFWNFCYFTFLHMRRFLVQCLWLWYSPLHILRDLCYILFAKFLYSVCQSHATTYNVLLCSRKAGLKCSLQNANWRKNCLQIHI